MSTINQDVFHKFQKLSLRQEADGHEIQIEVREDEEQSVKLQEIIDILVAAGYFRARIKGLSPFDKVVGGMTWCIESCNVDLDVDLLFQENSTIGQKIALTEKIVAVLPKLECPHRIEPHQIQGLDFIHIYPVIQWLVKRSLEFRQERSAFVRSFAITQFNKNFSSPSSEETKAVEIRLLDNLSAVNEVYRPRRYYKRKTMNSNEPLDTRVQVTLLEYGQRDNIRHVMSGKGIDGGNISEEEHSLQQIEQHLLNKLADTSETDINFDEISPEDRLLLAKHYANIQSEIMDGGVKSLNECKLNLIEHKLQQTKEIKVKLQPEKERLESNIKDLQKDLELVKSKQLKVDSSLVKIETDIKKDAENIKEVEELVILNDNLRSQELKFREHCKLELSNLQYLIDEKKNAKTPDFDPSENVKLIEIEQERVRLLRLNLAKKNRTIVALQRKLDDVPSRAELSQYQRRFLELYNQVAAKHKETKQYYTLYNTLEDTRMYMKKELSLLNSIAESYPEAIQSNTGKEEFLKQLERIVDGVRQSKVKVDQQLNEAKQNRNALNQDLNELVDLQRKYSAAVKQLSLEFKRHESILSQSKNCN